MLHIQTDIGAVHFKMCMHYIFLAQPVCIHYCCILHCVEIGIRLSERTLIYNYYKKAQV